MTALTLAAGAGFAAVLLRAIGRPVPLWLLALPLPLSAAVNLLVKRLIYVALAGAAGMNVIGPTSPFWFLIAVLLLPPVTEEGIKLVTLFLPFVRRRIRDGESAVLVGAAVGLGFGLGEALYVGYAVGLRVELASLPWYAFFPFLGERLAAIFIHGALTSIVAVGLHAAANIGPILAQFGIIGGDIASLFLFPFVLLIAGIFERQRRAVRPAAGGRVDEIYVRRV